MSATSASVEPPRPMPFAIMRNAHEALRASIRLQEERLAAGDHRGLRDEWKTFQRALAVHMAMEDRAMFGLLDETGNGAITAARLPAEHEEDVRLASAVSAALAQGTLWRGTDAANDAIHVDDSALRAAWTTWRDDHLHHLVHEEEVMMPLTMKTAATPQERARVVHERLLTPSEKLPDFDWYVGWVVRMLSHHGSAGQPAAVATRVFAWGLQHACSPAQWGRLRPIVKENCPAAMWEELNAQFGLGGDGPIA